MYIHLPTYYIILLTCMLGSFEFDLVVSILILNIIVYVHSLVAEFTVKLYWPFSAPFVCMSLLVNLSLASSSYTIFRLSSRDRKIEGDLSCVSKQGSTRLTDHLVKIVRKPRVSPTDHCIYDFRRLCHGNV